MSVQRKLAVQEGRAMVRVRSLRDRELATVAVCPACWNIRERREVLLAKLAKMELEVVHRDDLLDGRYRPNKAHAPGCPYSRLSADPWKRFASAIKRHRR
jgi:predicted DsbA family dithiol-disulfide isomerase